jgi:hypothetical protein
LLVLAATVKAQEKLTAEDILQRHLDSVGTAAIRSAAKSRVGGSKRLISDPVRG